MIANYGYENHIKKIILIVAPLTGFEPAAYGLTVHRSTTKLQRQQGRPNTTPS
tara:strand:+ start:233 stop:391 length:159 start_codon:yes stop_codon:yes gene_type:complete